MHRSPKRRPGLLRAAVVVGAVVVVAGASAPALLSPGTDSTGTARSLEASARGAAGQPPSRIARSGPGISLSKVATEPARSWSGVFAPGASFTLGSFDLATGSYFLDYSLRARFTGPLLSASSLECSLVEAGSGIRLEPQTATTLRTPDGWTRISRGIAVALPAMTVELRCALGAGGAVSFDTREVEYTAFRAL